MQNPPNTLNPAFSDLEESQAHPVPLFGMSTVMRRRSFRKSTAAEGASATALILPLAALSMSGSECTGCGGAPAAGSTVTPVCAGKQYGKKLLNEHIPQEVLLANGFEVLRFKDSEAAALVGRKAEYLNALSRASAALSISLKEFWLIFNARSNASASADLKAALLADSGSSVWTSEIKWIGGVDEIAEANVCQMKFVGRALLRDELEFLVSNQLISGSDELHRVGFAAGVNFSVEFLKKFTAPECWNNYFSIPFAEHFRETFSRNLELGDKAIAEQAASYAALHRTSPKP